MSRTGGMRRVSAQAVLLVLIITGICLLAGFIPLVHAHSHEDAKRLPATDQCELCLFALNMHSLLKCLYLTLFTVGYFAVLKLQSHCARCVGRAHQPVTLISLKVRLNP